MSRTTIGAALAVAALALAGTASAHAHGPAKTIKLTEASADLKPTFVDTGQPGPSAGDMAVIHDGVLRNGAPAGSYTRSARSRRSARARSRASPSASDRSR